MTPQRDIDLIDDLLSHHSELSWLEFKENNIDHHVIGKLCSAISNSARLDDRDFGYLLWGINDNTHQITGTDFDPHNAKTGNQPLQFWLAQQLKPSIPINFKIVSHPNGRIVILEIPATTSAPIAFENIAYIRIGSATPKLIDHDGHYKRLIDCLRPYTWEHGIAKQYVTSEMVLNLLDYTSYFRLTKQPLPDNRNGIFEKLEADRLITKNVGENY